MNPLIKLIGFRAGAYLLGEIKSALGPVAPYLRKLGIGISLVVSSVIAWMTALFFLLLSFFFYLGDLTQYATPALWSGLIAFAIGIVMVFSGLTMLRRPR